MKYVLVNALDSEVANTVNSQQSKIHLTNALTERLDHKSEAVIALKDLFKKYLRKDKTTIRDRPKCSFCGRRDTLSENAGVLSVFNLKRIKMINTQSVI